MNDLDFDKLDFDEILELLTGKRGIFDWDTIYRSVFGHNIVKKNIQVYKKHNGKLDIILAGTVIDLDDLILSYVHWGELWIIRKEMIFDKFSNKQEEMFFVVTSLSEIVGSKHYKMLVSNIDKVSFGGCGVCLTIGLESYLSYYGMHEIKDSRMEQ